MSDKAKTSPNIFYQIHMTILSSCASVAIVVMFSTSQFTARTLRSVVHEPSGLEPRDATTLDSSLLAVSWRLESRGATKDFVRISYCFFINTFDLRWRVYCRQRGSHTLRRRSEGKLELSHGVGIVWGYFLSSLSLCFQSHPYHFKPPCEYSQKSAHP